LNTWFRLVNNNLKNLKVVIDQYYDYKNLDLPLIEVNNND